VLIVTGCAPSDKYREKHMDSQIALLNNFQANRKPIIEIKNESGQAVTIPAGLSINFWGEQQAPILPYHESEVTKLWGGVINVVGNIVPAFMYGYFSYKNRELDVEMNKYNNETTRELYRTFAGGGQTQPGTSNTYTVSEGGVVVNDGSTYDPIEVKDSFNTLRYNNADSHNIDYATDSHDIDYDNTDSHDIDYETNETDSHDQTAPPYVVEQPEPTIVYQPEPIIVTQPPPIIVQPTTP
jgi:hypothetical protein